MNPTSPPLFIRQLPVGPMMNFAYIVGGDNGQTAVLIDPAWSASSLIAAAKNAGRTIEALLATHTHFDHINALEDVAKQLSVPVYVHASEAHELPAGLDVRTTKEGSVIEAAGIAIVCLHTPGHTVGSQCFLAGDALFTGDTLFDGACGRVDLEGSSPDDMIVSLARLAELPGETIVYPGHDYGRAKTTTIDEQRRTNPYMNEHAETIM